ncbi:MAG: beta strand repeat-containing protein, partial [Verrucomicrobiota bacterium]
MKRTLLKPLLILPLTLLLPTLGDAADGTWTNPAGGSWANGANWAGTVIADGLDSTARFSSLNITADATVTLDGARTVGGLEFGDATTASHNWLLNTGSGDPLTLTVSSGIPTIAVTNRVAVINAVLAGTNGFQKTGSGAVLLTAANTFTGTVINNGSDSKLAFSTPAAFNGQKIQLGLGLGAPQSRLIASGALMPLTNVIQLDTIRTIIGNDSINGLTAFDQTWNGTVILNHGNNNVHDIIAQKALTINGAVTEATPGLELRLNSGTLTVNGPIQVTGGFKMDSGSTTFTGTNTYSGGTTLLAGNLFLANASGNALPAGIAALQGSARIFLSANNQMDDAAVIQFNNTGATANNARLDLTGFNDTIAGISDLATSGNRIVEAANDTVLNAPATLTLNVPAGQSYTHKSYIRNGAGAGSILTVTKSGLGQQTFSGGSGLVNWTGLTTVNAGILEISGASSVLANSPVNLAGGTLLFSGTSGTGLRAQSITNDLTGSGTLRKAGAMALQLGSTTVNTFSGSTIVDGGILQVQAGGILASNAAVVNNGGTLEILGNLYATSTTVNPGGVLVSGSGSAPSAEVGGPVTNLGGVIRGWAILDNVSMQSGTINPALGSQAATLTIGQLACQGGTLAFDLNPGDTTAGSGINDLLAIGTLTLSSPTMIDLPGAATLTGARYVVMTYNTLVGSPANLYLNPTVSGLRSQPSIDTSVLGEIAIVFGNPGAVTARSLIWQGGLNGNAWDIGTTTNWLELGTPNSFYAGDAVAFDDSSTNYAVNLTAAVYPGAVAFNNFATNYVISGAGSLNASAGLTESGSGGLTLNVPASIGTTLQLSSGSTVTMTGSSNYLNGTFAMDASSSGSTFILTGGAYLNAPVAGGSFNVTSGNNLLVIAGAGSTLNVPGVGGVGVGNSASASGNTIIVRDGGAWTNIPNNFVIGQGSAFNNQLILTNGGRLTWGTGAVGSVLLGHGTGAYDNSLKVLGATSVLDLNGVSLYSGRNGNNNVTTVDSGVITNCGNVNINDLGDGQGNGVNVLNGGRLYSKSGINIGANAHTSVDAFFKVDGGSVWAASANIGGNALATGSTLTLTNGGSLTISNALVVNNPSSVVTFASGTVTAGSLTVNNGQVFTVGDGVNAATLTLNGGSSTFANDLTIAANATLKGNGSVGVGNTMVNG